MSEETPVNDLVLLDLHYSGLLRGDLADEVQARLTSGPAFQAMVEQDLTNWTDLLGMLEPERLVPDGAENRLFLRRSRTQQN